MLRSLFSQLNRALLLPLCRALTRLQTHQLKTIRRIGFLNMGGLGDYMLFSPVVRAIRAAYPQASLMMISATNYAAVGEIFPEVDEAILLTRQECGLMNMLRLLQESQLDVLIINHDFQIPLFVLSIAMLFSGIPLRIGCRRNELRETALTQAFSDRRQTQDPYLMHAFFELAETFFRTTGKPVPPDPFAFYPTRLPESAITTIQETLATLQLATDTTKILIHPGTSKSSKEENWSKSWPPTSWAALSEQLLTARPDTHILLTGGPDDREEIAAIWTAMAAFPPALRLRIRNIDGMFPTVSSLQALMATCDLFIGCDSFAMHVALSVEAPQVAIFALTDESRFLPSGHPRVAVATCPELACRPCIPGIRATACENPVCLNVPVEIVLEKALDMLNSRPEHQKIIA